MDEIASHAVADSSEFEFHVWLEEYGVSEYEELSTEEYAQSYDIFHEERLEYYKTLPQYQLGAVKQVIKQNDMDNHEFDRIYDMCFPLSEP